jgi:hypothetical protein
MKGWYQASHDSKKKIERSLVSVFLEKTLVRAHSSGSYVAGMGAFIFLRNSSQKNALDCSIEFLWNPPFLDKSCP